MLTRFTTLFVLASLIATLLQPLAWAGDRDEFPGRRQGGGGWWRVALPALVSG